MLREPAAIGSWLALGAVSLAGASRLGASARRTIPVLIAILFFISAAATRYWLRDTRSRWQIVAFVVAASVIALSHRRAGGGSAAAVVWTIWVGCSVLGVILVRWATEGSPI